jgi:predicted regulator of Ras-like GTPase activity (Roadblock/LC7/MglB family)
MHILCMSHVATVSLHDTALSRKAYGVYRASFVTADGVIIAAEVAATHTAAKDTTATVAAIKQQSCRVMSCS